MYTFGSKTINSLYNVIRIFIQICLSRQDFSHPSFSFEVWYMFLKLGFSVSTSCERRIIKFAEITVVLELVACLVRWRTLWYWFRLKLKYSCDMMKDNIYTNSNWAYATHIRNRACSYISNLFYSRTSISFKLELRKYL